MLAAIREAFGVSSRDAQDIEVTVECNPSSLDARKAAELREVGVNRLSLGVQSLDNSRLRFLGRLHDAQGALDAVSAACTQHARVSGDFMFGMPGQKADDFLAELSRLLELGLSHVSAYALTVEPQTQFGELHRKGKLTLAKEDDFAETYLATERFLAERGFEHYEVSNYAKPGESSRHNQHYWRGGDYLGLGAGAVGCLTQGQGQAQRYKNDANPARYMQGSGDASIATFREALDGQAQVREALMLGLRTHEGVALEALRARTGEDPRKGREREVERALERGNLIEENGRWQVPHARWLHLDAIVADLF